MLHALVMQLVSPVVADDQLPAEEALALPCYNNPTDWQDTKSYTRQELAQSRCILECRQKSWCAQQYANSVQLHGKANVLGVWAGVIHRRSDT